MGYDNDLSIWFDIRKFNDGTLYVQPPSGGCELKPIITDTHFGVSKASRLRAAVS